MIESDEIIFVMDIVSSKKTNAIAKNVTSTASINYHWKKVRGYYFLHTVLLFIKLLLIIIIIRIYDGIVWHWKIWHYLRQHNISYKYEKQYHIYFFSLFCKKSKLILMILCLRKNIGIA